MKKYLVLALIVLFAGCTDNSQKESVVAQNLNEENITLVPATILEEGWETPIKLEFNDAGWEDSPYLTRNGSQILFFYHPWGDLAVPQRLTELTEYLVYNQKEALEKGLDPKVYFSNKPFKDKHVHPISQNKKYPSSEACPYISESGDIFYCGTLESWLQGKSVPGSTYKNGKRIYLGTGEDEGNPHYCDALDELWFDCPGDQNICVLEDAEKNNFNGTPHLLPSPINLGESVQDFQPFLTDDCMTLYFSSNRDGIIKIYKSKRQNDSWSEPELYIDHPAGVAELSMTSDGNEMAFAQLFWRDDGTPGVDIWYSKRK